MSNCVQTLLLFVVFGAFFGCQKYSEYRETPQGGVIITPEGIQIKDVKIIRWKVGKSRKKEISKGIKFHFTLPLVKKEYLENLLKIDIDSWIVKVARERIITSENLDYFTIPLLVPQKRVFGKSGLKPMKSGRINIFYASSFVSPEDFSYVCPKLGHRKIIRELDVKQTKSIERHIAVSIINESSLRIKSRYMGYESEKINGGKSLQGDYFIELALYSQKKQKIMSNWFRIDEKIVIGTEKEIALEGCPHYDGSSPFGVN